MARAAGMEGSLGRVPDQDEFRVLDQVLEVAGPPLVKPPRVVVGDEAAAPNLRDDVVAVIGDHAEEAGVDTLVAKPRHLRAGLVVRPSHQPSITARSTSAYTLRS